MGDVARAVEQRRTARTSAIQAKIRRARVRCLTKFQRPIASVAKVAVHVHHPPPFRAEAKKLGTSLGNQRNHFTKSLDVTHTPAKSVAPSRFASAKGRITSSVGIRRALIAHQPVVCTNKL